MDKFDHVSLMFAVMTTVVGACVSPVSNLQLDNLTIDVLLDQDQYCIVDECTIRINDSNVLLNIINNTGDWIMATNTTNLFTAPNNGTNCTPHQDVATAVYFISIIVIHCVSLILSLANIILHLIVKELRTVSGKLIIALCVLIAFISLITIVLGVFQLLHLADTGNCNGFKYAAVILGIAYESIKVNILFHFTYLMYQSHKMSSNTKKDKTFLCSYFICDAGVTLTHVVVFLVVDQNSDTSAFFITSEGFCDFRNLSDNFLFYYMVIALTILVLTETILFVTGIILYYLVNRSLCTVKGQGNVRVIFTLFSTVGLNAVIYVCLNQASHSSGVIKLGTSVATCIEQFTLLIIYLTSNKVKIAFDSMLKR